MRRHHLTGTFSGLAIGTEVKQLLVINERNAKSIQKSDAAENIQGKGLMLRKVHKGLPFHVEDTNRRLVSVSSKGAGRRGATRRKRENEAISCLLHSVIGQARPGSAGVSPPVTLPFLLRAGRPRSQGDTSDVVYISISHPAIFSRDPIIAPAMNNARARPCKRISGWTLRWTEGVTNGRM